MPTPHRNQVRALGTINAALGGSPRCPGTWLAALLAAILLVPVAGANAQTLARLPERGTFYLTPTVEGIYSCDEGLANPARPNCSTIFGYTSGGVER